MNRAFIRADEYREANKISEVGKQIGMSPNQNKEGILEKLVDMEERDRSQHMEDQGRRNKQEGVTRVSQ